MKPLPCQHSGCIKFAHKACQDNWAAINLVTPFNVAYTLCREHHPQYCRFIEELNENNLANGVKEDNKQAFAKENNDETKCNVDDDDNNNFFDIQEEKVEDNK